MNELSYKIDQLRVQRGWNQNQLATESGVSVQAIRKWSQTEAYPTIPMLKQICSAFGITLGVFFAEGNLVELAPDFKAVYDKWPLLRKSQREAVIAVIDGYLANNK